MMNFLDNNNIYFPQVRDYFDEVFSSYASKNYRSAVVMLYSTTVCDILLKLQELRDVYNDGVAKNILQTVDSSRKQSDGKSKSAWEWELIESVHKETQFLDNESYISISHLYDYRNMCAHPVVNDLYELYKPSNEIVIALIKSILENVLCKPPIYIKGVFNTLLDDLANKREDFKNDRKQLESYLNNRYYNRMSDKMKLKVARSLWKITFMLDNDECSENRLINRQALEILMVTIRKDFFHQVDADKEHYLIADNDTVKMHFSVFLAKFPEFYSALSSDTKFTIDKFIERNDRAKAISWFKYSKMPELLANLKFDDNIDGDTLRFMYQEYSEQGYKKELIDFFINYFAASTSFDVANNRFEKTIENHLGEMLGNQLLSVIKAIDENDQLHNRRNSSYDNATIVYYVRKILGESFDFSQYKHFEFDEEQVTKAAERLEKRNVEQIL